MIKIKTIIYYFKEKWVIDLGRIIGTQELVQSNIQGYIDQTTSDYARYLQNAPTFVTYYKKNGLHSTKDVNLEAVREVIGDDSPIQFDRIENFAIYGIEESLPNIESGDFGIDTEMGSDAIIIPDTIKPTPDDFFVISYNGSQILFRVTDVTIDRIKGKPFYKITFELDESNTREIEEQTQDEYTFIYENLGTEQKSVVLNTEFIKLKDIEKLFNKLYDFYIKAFFNKRFNVLSFNFNGKIIYNRYLIKFIIDNNILEKKYNYLSSVVIDDVMGELYEFESFYNNSIYSIIQNKNIDELEVENFKLFPIPLDNHNLPFYHHYETFYQCLYKTTSGNIYEDYGINTVVPHQAEFIHKVKNNELFEHDRYLLENIIISYVNNTIESEELFDKINSVRLNPYLNEFLLLPCAMYILNTLKHDILNNKKLINDEGRY